MSIILGVETSCDDTCISILNNEKVVVSEVYNNNSLYKNFGGIIPELASRNHERSILKVFNKVIKKAKLKFNQINFIAYTNTPGLVGCLHVGIIFAKTLSFLLNIKAYPINHIYGHIFSPFIGQKNIEYPFLSLVVSGKTSSLFLVKSSIDIQELSKTHDDAIGETYDKVGRRLGFDYPGGPKIDKIYDESKATIKFVCSKQIDSFSYSGLKSQVLNYINKIDLNENKIIEIASSFQKVVILDLVKKLKYFNDLYNVKSICISGGVSANTFFRDTMKLHFKNFYFPLPIYSCDNAAMIAYYFYLINKRKDN